LHLEIKFIGSMAEHYPAQGKIKHVIKQEEALTGNNILLKKLTGGNLNHVWRATDQDGNNVIVKYAPPFIAKQPEIPLDDSRIQFESRILKAFLDDEQMSGLTNAAMRVPIFLGFDKTENILMMEYVGDLKNINEYINQNRDAIGKMGKELGIFIAGLHLATFNEDSYRKKFTNLPVQKTRFEVQYKQCGKFAEKAGISSKLARKVHEHCHELGQKLMGEGICIIMGDLWPESILVDSNTGSLVLIDWEMCHFGNPIQDVAHLDAHLWMMQHRCSDENSQKEIAKFQNDFTEQYRNELNKNPAFAQQFCERDYAIHYGAEILARTTGSFQSGYLYDGLSHDAKPIQEAVNHAVSKIIAISG